MNFHEKLSKLLPKIIISDAHHARWLNTLSYLENCGARKIASYEHPKKVKEEILKHAAEEFRHAHYLKKQIKRISDESLFDYSINSILGGTESWNYLLKLDLDISRYLTNWTRLSKNQIKEGAYLLVTYTIELRAKELYTLYDLFLRRFKSKVKVKSILLEENEHLKEMEKELALFPNGFQHAKAVESIEAKLCERWLQKLNSIFHRPFI